MSDFPINVKVDPGDAPQKIDRVTGAMASAERQAHTMRGAFDQARSNVLGFGAAARTVGGNVRDHLLGMISPAGVAMRALDAIGAGFEELRRRAEDTRIATVAMLRYRDTVEEARASAEGLRGTAKLLGEDLKATAGLFLDVAGAASDLHLSEKQITDITRNLGIIMRTEGKPIGEVASVMARLQFAISRNAISAGELSSVMIRFDPIAAVWRREFGMTNAELLKAADSGELVRRGIGRLATSLVDASDNLRKYQQVLRASADTSGKSFSDAARDVFKYREQQIELGKVAKDAGVTLDSWDPRLGRLRGGLKRASDASKDLRSSIAALANTSAFDSLIDKARELGGELRSIVHDDWGDSPLDRLLAGVGRRFEAAKQAAAEARAEAKAWREELARIPKEPALRSVGPAGHEMMSGFLPNSVASFAAIDAAWTKPIDKAHEYKRAIDEIAMRQEKWAAETASNQDGIARGFNAIDRELHNTAQLTEQLLVGAFHNLEDAIVQAATTGELSFSRMIDGFISDLTRLALRQAALGLAGLFGPGGTPSVFGTGATQAFSGLYGSAGLDFRVPGFSAGGEGTVRGGGGMTDAVPVAFWATQGERVIVQTQGQQAAARDAASSSASSPPPVVPVVVTLDERALLRALQSPLGATAIDNVLRKNPGLLKR